MFPVAKDYVEDMAHFNCWMSQQMGSYLIIYIVVTRRELHYLQVNKKFRELKGGNIGIVEKAQETRFGMSPKYSRYIGIAA